MSAPNAANDSVASTDVAAVATDGSSSVNDRSATEACPPVPSPSVLPPVAGPETSAVNPSSSVGGPLAVASSGTVAAGTSAIDAASAPITGSASANGSSSTSAPNGATSETSCAETVATRPASQGSVDMPNIPTSTTIPLINGHSPEDANGKRNTAGLTGFAEVSNHIKGEVHHSGGRLAAFASNGVTRLVTACSTGCLAEVSVTLEGAANSLVYGTEPGLLDSSCHPASRVCIVQSSNDKIALLYQAVDGSIVQKTSGIQDKIWSNEEVIVSSQPATDKESAVVPLVGTTLAAFAANGIPSLIWQTKNGVLARTELNDKTTCAVIGVKVALGTNIATVCCSEVDGLNLLWVDEEDRLVREAIGPARPTPGAFVMMPAKHEWQLRARGTEIAVLGGSEGGDESKLFYSVDSEGECAEWDGAGQMRRRLSPYGKHANPHTGLALATEPSPASTSGPSVFGTFQVFYFDEPRSQMVMLYRDLNGRWTSEIPLDGTEAWGHASRPHGASRANGHKSLEAVFAGPGYGETNASSQAADSAATGVAGTGASIGLWIRKTCKDLIVPKLNKTATAGGDHVKRAASTSEAGSETSKGLVHAVIASRDKLWPSNPQVIRYFFMEGTPEQRQKVAESVEEWTYYANVSFVEADSADNSKVRITFDPNDGSYSYVGTDCEHVSSDKHTMNLAWLDPSSVLTRREKAVVLHEFGHVLGLLHEHQSPAHGGVAIKNIDLALKMYRDSQGWSDQEIMDQVIRPYQQTQISSYSAFDPTSVMMYPMAKELTGLDYDIEYNYDLSKMDKAYMVLQYPRASPHPSAPEWTLQYALDVIGCPPDIAAAVLASAETDRQPGSKEIDPTEMRKIVGKWAIESHKPNLDAMPPQADAKPTDTVAHGVNDGCASQIGKQFDEDNQDNLLLVDLGDKQVDGGMCATENVGPLAARVAKKDDDPGQAHAVTDSTSLISIGADLDDAKLRITYGFSAGYRKPNAYQQGLFRAACDRWELFAHIRFEETASGVEPDLMVVFHSNDPDDNRYNHDVTPDSDQRSITVLPMTRTRAATVARRNAQRHLDICTNLAEGDLHPQVPWDICYYGIFKSDSEAAAWKSSTWTGINGKQMNTRTLLHELGHWLGLVHEDEGLYSAWIRDQTLLKRKALADKAKALHATKYDTGSVMDSIGHRISKVAADLLLRKGLQAASLVGLGRESDVTGDIVKMVNISLNLSVYDKANIALLYPGVSNLVVRRSPGTAGPPYELAVLPGSAQETVVSRLLRYLKIPMADAGTMTAALVQGKWNDARNDYLALLSNAQAREHTCVTAYLDELARAVLVREVPAAEPSVGSKRKSRKEFIISYDDSDDRPAHDIVLRDVTGGDKKKDEPQVEGPFIQTIYKKLATFFPPGDGQYFALQFPTRFLDKESYAYDTSGVFSRFDKPVVVNEAEFRLTDALYPLGPIVGGPNGQSLSSNYLKALNSLTPTYDGTSARKQREKMRAWLLTQTHKDDAAYTVDTRLTMSGLDADAAHQLSNSTGIRVAPSDKVASDGSGPIRYADSAGSDPAVAHAQNAVRGIASTGLARPRQMTRMEFADSLTQEYLDNRMKWELYRDQMIADAEKSDDRKALEAVTRKLARITSVENAKLASKYADAVVRGHSHTVRELMGHLDVRTTAELLEDAKDSLRESSLSSLYTASSVYPVQMEPADWFLALDTGFTREDLSQTPELMQESIQAKASQVDSLQTQIANLRGFATIDPKEAQSKVKKAAEDKNAALMALNGAYTASTISAVKLVLEAASSSTPMGAASVGITATAESTLKAVKAKPDTDAEKGKLKKLLGDDFEKVDEIGKQMDTVTKANNTLNARSRELAELMSQAALAEAGDTHVMVENLQRKLTAAQAELQNLTESYGLSRRAEQKKKEDLVKNAADVGALPPGGSTGGGGTRWIELSLCSEVSNSTTSTETMSHASSTDWSCDFWIGSYAKSSSESNASTDTKTAHSTFKVDLSMRVTYVTVDRAGWFDPSLLAMSSSFMHSVPDIDYTPWAQWNAKETTTKRVNGKDVQVEVPASPRYVADKIVKEGSKSDAGSSRDRTVDGYFTHFPVGYVLVKDCVIRVYTDAYSSDDAKSNFEKSSSESGGFLCFSHSNSSHDSGSSSSSSSTFTKDGIVIRIPGPQILGYIMQLTSPDQTKTFSEMPLDYLLDDDSSKDQVAHGVSRDVGPLSGVSDAASASFAYGVRQYDVGSAPERSGPVLSKGSVSTDPGDRPAAMVNGQPAAPPKFEDKLREAVDAAPGLKGRSAEERSEIINLIEKLLAPPK